MAGNKVTSGRRGGYFGLMSNKNKSYLGRRAVTTSQGRSGDLSIFKFWREKRVTSTGAGTVASTGAGTAASGSFSE